MVQPLDLIIERNNIRTYPSDEILEHDFSEAEIADLMRVSKSTIRKLKADKDLPYKKDANSGRILIKGLAFYNWFGRLHRIPKRSGDPLWNLQDKVLDAKDIHNYLQLSYGQANSLFNGDELPHYRWTLGRTTAPRLVLPFEFYTWLEQRRGDNNADENLFTPYENVDFTQPLATEEQAAGALRVSARKLDDYIIEGMPYFQIASHRRFKISEIREWKQKYVVKSNSTRVMRGRAGSGYNLPDQLWKPPEWASEESGLTLNQIWKFSRSPSVFTVESDNGAGELLIEVGSLISLIERKRRNRHAGNLYKAYRSEVFS